MSNPVCHVIRPDGWEIPAGAALIHGITTEMAHEAGKPLSEVLDALEITILAADRIVAHNTEFDIPVLGAEFLRAGRRDPLAGKPRTCTMRSLTDWCKIPGPYGYKWPTLQELHEKLFSEKFEDAHRAETDVLACARCYREARARGIL
jgi:DNA polymerase-3 subunit alpha/DNA polymerase-3 subunit epsilon